MEAYNSYILLGSVWYTEMKINRNGMECNPVFGLQSPSKPPNSTVQASTTAMVAFLLQISALLLLVSTSATAITHKDSVWCL